MLYYLRNLVILALLLGWPNWYALAQWSTPVRISEPGDCWDPQILAVGDTLHVVYENTGAGYDKIGYVRSTDGGDTWSEPVRLSERRGATLFPRIVQDGPRLMALWKQIFNSGYDRFNIGYAVSADHGATWDTARYIFDPNWPGILYFTATNWHSTVVIVLGTQEGYDFVYYSFHSTDFGASWSSPGLILNAYDSGRSDIAMSDSTVHFSWGGRFDADFDWETYYLRSSDGGISWSANIALSEVDEFHSYNPAICANRVGLVALAWMDFKRSPYWTTGDIFVRTSSDQGLNWLPEVQITERHRSTLSDIGYQGDSLYVAWQDQRPENGNFSIYFSQSTDGGLTWSQEYRLDRDSLESREPTLATFNGAIYAVWAETRYSTDTSGLYFTSFQAEPDAAEDMNENIQPDITNVAAYPNPFNDATVFSIGGNGDADIVIYDVTGKRVTELASSEGVAVWRPDGLSTGVYFARVKGSAGRGKTLRVIYLK